MKNFLLFLVACTSLLVGSHAEYETTFASRASKQQPLGSLSAAAKQEGILAAGLHDGVTDDMGLHGIKVLPHLLKHGNRSPCPHYFSSLNLALNKESGAKDGATVVGRLLTGLLSRR